MLQCSPCAAEMPLESTSLLKDWVPRGAEHRFGDTPMFCSLLLAVFVPPLPHLLVL